MTKKLSLSHKIMGKIAMVTPDSLIAKSIVKINQSISQFLPLIFQSWEKNDDPAEQEGKGVAIKSCTQFFTWLKEVGHSSNSSYVPLSIIFVSGGGGGRRLVGCGCCGDICKKSFAPRRIEIQTVALSYSRPALC